MPGYPYTRAVCCLEVFSTVSLDSALRLGEGKEPISRSCRSWFVSMSASGATSPVLWVSRTTTIVGTRGRRLVLNTSEGLLLQWIARQLPYRRLGVHVR